MKCELTTEQIQFFQTNGFIVIEDFLSPEELTKWREAVTEAIKERNGLKMPGKSAQMGMDDGINKDSEYFSKVFDQLLNLWQTNDKVKDIMLDERIGKMASQLSGADGIRIWHDQAPVSYTHLDVYKRQTFVSTSPRSCLQSVVLLT